MLKRCEKGVNIFDELDAFFYEQECQQARHSIVRTMHHGPMWNKHIGHRVQVGQSELRLRPPTDVIDAAFGLVKLSAAPRNVVTTFNKGTVHAVPRNIKKTAPLRY